jgi:GT2 family glycosyltransferase
MGLTKQQIMERVGERDGNSLFLDDDIVLENDYFEQLLKTYEIYPLWCWVIDK